MKSTTKNSIVKLQSTHLQNITLIQETYYSSLTKSNISTSFCNTHRKIKKQKIKFTPFPTAQTTSVTNFTCNTFRPKNTVIFEKIIGTTSKRKISVNSNESNMLTLHDDCYDISEISDFELDI